MNIIRLASTPSTNAAAAAMGAAAEDGTVVATAEQSAGRGQRGNTWESEPGKNLTFSIVVRRGFEAPRQFELSMLVSLGVTAALSKYLDPSRLKVKWPNDIYFDDRKLAGILIENTVNSRGIERSIVGIGLNVNQTEFMSEAPNPVSMKGITGETYDLETLLEETAGTVLDFIDQYCSVEEPDELHALYMQRLWRNDGQTHAWTDTTEKKAESDISMPTPFTPSGKAEGTPFYACIADVRLDGTLLLRPTAPDGTPVIPATVRPFAFKQVAALL